MAFVLLKGLAEKSSTWSSHFWSKFTAGSSKPTDPNGVSGGQINQPLHAQPKYDPKLPQVPKATMTGMRSFFDKFGNSKAEKTHATADTDGLDMTLMSVDYDYHKQLRAGSMDRRPRSDL